MHADWKIPVFQPYMSCQQYLTVVLFVPSWPLSLVISLVSLIHPYCHHSQLLTLTPPAFSLPTYSITTFKELSLKFSSFPLSLQLLYFRPLSSHLGIIVVAQL